MNFERGWSHYFHLLKCLGIIPISINKIGNVVSTKRDKQICLIVAVTLIVFNTLLMSNTILFVKNSSMYEEFSKTGKIYEYIEQIANGVLLKIILIWMLIFRNENINVIQKIFQVEKETKLYSSPMNINFTWKYYKIFMFCSFFLLIDSVIHIFAVQFYNLTFLVQLIQYFLYYFCSSILISFYTVLILKIKNILKTINFQLNIICKKKLNIGKSLEILKLLSIRNDLLSICCGTMSTVFGLTNLLYLLYILIDLVQIWFFIVLIMEFRNLDVWMILNFINGLSIWLLPKIIVMLGLFSCNGIPKQVSFYFF